MREGRDTGIYQPQLIEGRFRTGNRKKKKKRYHLISAAVVNDQILDERSS